MSTIDSPVTTPPQPVTVSYWLYIVGAVIGLIGAIVGFALIPSVIAQATEAAGQAVQGQDTNGVDVAGVATGAVIGGAVLSGVITLAFTILTIVFARKMRQGRNWARIVLAVFAGLQLFGVLGAYGIGAIHFLVVLAALILSFLPASNAWFRAQRTTPPAV